MKKFSCELSLIIALIINSVNLCLLIKSGFGISTLSSVPLTISNIITSITFGTWTIIIQVITMLIMISLTKTFKIGYIGSFITAFIFGILVDIITTLISNFPINIYFRIVYFLIGFVGISIGASLFIKSRLPIMPFDLFVRDVSQARKWKIKTVKRTYDMISVSISISLGLIFLNKIVGIGIGTIICMFFTGTITQYFVKLLDEHFVFEPTFKISNKIIKITEILK